MFPDLDALSLTAKPITIGQFYAKICEQILELSQKGNIPTGDQEQQLAQWHPPLTNI